MSYNINNIQTIYTRADLSPLLPPQFTLDLMLINVCQFCFMNLHSVGFTRAQCLDIKFVYNTILASVLVLIKIHFSSM